MILIKGYIITKLLYDQGDSLFYRGYRQSDKVRVVIKVLKDEYNDDVDALSRYYHEYTLLTKLQNEGIIQVYALEKQEKNLLALIYEDFGTSTLKESMLQKKLSLEEFLQYAVHILEALENIHSRHIIHNNLNPETILCDKTNNSIKVIDFSHAYIFHDSNIEMKNVNKTNSFKYNELHYIAPEQTGLINRQVDYRSDYYSIGVMFYEMCTGSLPFQSYDTDNLIYAHIAQSAISPSQIDPAIPLVISAVIMKLLAKHPEDRYQSIRGIKADILKCLNEFQKNRDIAPFDIATEDAPEHFLISGKLYGRNAPQQLLNLCMDEAINGHSKLVLLSAEAAGYGMASICRELYKSIYPKNGFLVRGCYSKQSYGIPYSGLIAAIDDLIRQILQQSEIQIRHWRKSILNSLGVNGQVMIEMIPSLARLIGKQPPLTALDLKESENRFYIAIKNLLRVLATPEHPLIIYLNAQWIDAPTLQVLEKYLLLPESSNCLIILAYNETDLDNSSEIKALLTKKNKTNIPYVSIKLEALSLHDTIDMLMDTFKHTKDKVLPLAKICVEKSRGNPLLLKDFLNVLHNDNLIFFDKNEWKWDLTDTDKVAFSPDINSFVIKKIKEIDLPAQQTIQIAACFDGDFDLTSLAAIKKPLKLIAEEILAAIRAEVITSNHDIYLLVAMLENNLLEGQNYNCRFQFVNNHVRNIVYATIPKKNLDEYHLSIGPILLAQNNCSYC